MSATYVYGLVAADRRPALRRRPAPLPGLGPVRLLDVEPGLWLVVADASLARFSEQTINRKLADLAWVSKAAVAHDAVVESFRSANAVLPMKLFTIFTSDERALAQVCGDRPRVRGLIARVAGRDEWGVRVTLDRSRLAAPPAAAAAKPAGTRRIGARYLAGKKAQRDRAAAIVSHAREAIDGLYDRLAKRAGLARRRAASDAPADGGPLLLDAAFLVPRTLARQFTALAARQARTLDRFGYRVSLTGPWPPYTFVKD